jgi:hypothetical protein
MWVLSLFVIGLLALATAAVAESRGQSGALWFLVGLIAPVVGLLIALVALEPAGKVETSIPSAPEAARRNPVARLLASEPGLPVDAVTERTGSTDRAVIEQLGALRALGYAERDSSGRWGLTEQGADALEH